ncbi:hypothetical protein AGOR_G00105930 [Albula goreensis]|uniref:Uncharacterized protein n=1 Tax=Albula goreensis TaxID=1534307 RepID=A0A8T3DE02_9TELE|nr:hypothetical protein AGOR_G00105930 [Albula goreensis]
MNKPGISDRCDGKTSRTRYNSWDFEDLSGLSFGSPESRQLDSPFGEWIFFSEEDGLTDHDKCVPKSEFFDALSQRRLETSEHSIRVPEKVVESPGPLKIFHIFFPSVNTSEDSTTSEIKPLLQKLTEPVPSSSPILCSDAASLWCCLCREPSGRRLLESSPYPHSRRGLLSALRITPKNVSSQQSTPPAETDPEETSREPLRPPASPLIQTKLLASPYCRNTPSFLYQISCQWLPSPNLRPQDHSHKRGFFF